MAAAIYVQESSDEHARTWYGDVFIEDPVMMLNEQAEPRTKRARISRSRADYATFSWGVMLQNKQLQVRGSKEAKDFKEPVSRALRVPAAPCGDGAAMVSSPPERCSRPAYYTHGATGIVCVEIRCEDEGMIWPLRKVSCLVHDMYTVLFS